MKTFVTYLIIGLVALAAGVALIYSADRFGWIPERYADRPPADSDASSTDPTAPPSASPGDNDNDNGVIVRNAAADASDAIEVLRTARAPSATCTNAFSTVRLASPEVARRTGLRVVPARTESVELTVSANARVAFDESRYAHLASRAAGVVAEVRADLGDRVTAGAVLAVVDSSELGAAKAAYLQARSLVELWERNAARERDLLEGGLGVERDLLEAETALVESRVQESNAAQRLRNLGLSDDDLAQVRSDADTSSRLPLVAPFDGVVVDRHAVVGEVVSSSDPLFSVADTSRMWAMLDINESEVTRLEPGQPVRLQFASIPGRAFAGALTWISPQVDAQTRAIRARAEFDNADGALRANMFGRARVEVRTIDDALLVPEDAVQWDGCCNIVFVRQTDTVYQPYQVTLGPEINGWFVVEDGLRPGDEVVTRGSFLLKTEILKGNIGAGCCEVDPGANR
ncbi:MAG: efflux RND transporter periplasmic adaptor subunit [Phycisphaerales bacterium]